MIEVPAIRFAPARGARLAYQLFGEGPEHVVAIPPMAQNIELSWERPEIRRMLVRFGSFCTYLHFDKRGTGCSDRRSRIADIDERVDDLRAVMDHAQIERAHLFGSSEGGPMTLLFAATYPERVASVILFGSGASLQPPMMSDDDLARLREVHRALAAAWGTPASPMAQAFAPSIAAADPTFATWHQRYERLAASQDSLRDLLELGLHMDVRELLPRLQVPTLVIHRIGDLIVPIERGREVAAAVPGARLVEQPGSDHFAYAGDVDGWMREFERFVTGRVTPRPVVRGLARPTIRVITLGRFAVEVDGQEVPTREWGSRRARQLCMRLVAARGWPVTRETLFDLLWPGETDRQRLGSRLSVQLSTVRRILRGGVIADRETVRLDLGQVDTDLEAFHRAGDDDAVVAAFTGDFLVQEVEDWVRGVRAEVRSRFVPAAQRAAATALAGGDHARAIEVAHRLVALDGFDETGHRLLVTTLARTGALAEARHAHAAWERAMHELDVPVPAFEAVVATTDRKVV